MSGLFPLTWLSHCLNPTMPHHSRPVNSSLTIRLDQCIQFDASGLSASPSLVRLLLPPSFPTYLSLILPISISLPPHPFCSRLTFVLSLPSSHSSPLSRILAFSTSLPFAFFCSSLLQSPRPAAAGLSFLYALSLARGGTSALKQPRQKFSSFSSFHVSLLPGFSSFLDFGAKVARVFRGQLN